MELAAVGLGLLPGLGDPLLAAAPGLAGVGRAGGRGRPPGAGRDPGSTAGTASRAGGSRRPGAAGGATARSTGGSGSSQAFRVEAQALDPGERGGLGRLPGAVPGRDVRGRPGIAGSPSASSNGEPAVDGLGAGMPGRSARRRAASAAGRRPRPRDRPIRRGDRDRAPGGGGESLCRPSPRPRPRAPASAGSASRGRPARGTRSRPARRGLDGRRLLGRVADLDHPVFGPCPRPSVDLPDWSIRQPPALPPTPVPRMVWPWGSSNASISAAEGTPSLARSAGRSVSPSAWRRPRPTGRPPAPGPPGGR